MTPGAKSRILFIEDDASGREMGTFNLQAAGYLVQAAASGEAGLALFSPEHHDLVITDVRMASVSGLDVLRSVKQAAPDVPVLVITAYGSVELAVEAMRAGAYDFLEKPFSRDQLQLTVARALENRALRAEVRRLRRKASGVERPIVAASDAMNRVLELADRVASSDVSVLITGETGTGKELVARRIHARSKRAEGPFVALSCAAIPADLIESELFGHEKGAFTGASRPRKGRFRQADGGTIFLDEVAELLPGLQGKLLRVLQERVVNAVGADVDTPVDVRVVAATHQDLAARTADGTFRQDLLYRLNVMEIRVPPLRERPQDIEPLAKHFLLRLSGERELVFEQGLFEALRSRAWPGNVRQLENACERLLLLAQDDTLRVRDLPLDGAVAGPSSVQEWPPLPPEGLGLVDLEKRVIERVLALKAGNVSQAAQYLRVPRHILAYRMEKYGLRRT